MTAILEGITYLFKDLIFGNPVMFALMIIVMFLILLILARVTLDNMIVFLIMPIWALKEASYLSGIVSGSLFGIMIIIAGFILFKNIKKLVGN